MSIKTAAEYYVSLVVSSKFDSFYKKDDLIVFCEMEVDSFPP